MHRALRAPVDLVICDRYIYDELANLTLRNPAARLYVRLIMKLVPRPHISYLLDVDPAQAFARKPEYPLAFLYTSRRSYLSLSELVGGMTVISPMSARAVEGQVFKHARALLSLDSSQSEPAKHSIHRDDRAISI
jgi:hypothetical protein